MAVIAMATADLDELDQFISHSRCTIDTTYARTGTKSFKTRLFSGFWVLQYASKAELYTRVALLQGVDAISIRWQHADTIQCTVTLDFGRIQAYYRSTTSLLGEVSVPFSPEVWSVYEIYVKIHNPNGIITIKKDGVQVLSATGRTNFNSETVNELRIDQLGTSDCYWDDILVDDANWPGLGGIEVIRPDGDGTDQEWDSGTYADVNTDNDATYVATDAEVAAKQSFTIPALAADRHTPTAVGLFTKSQLSGAGAGTLRPYLDANQGQSLALSTSLQYTKDYQVAYPSEVGLEVVV